MDPRIRLIMCTNFKTEDCARQSRCSLPIPLMGSGAPRQSHVGTLRNRTFRRIPFVVFTNKENSSFPNHTSTRNWRTQVSHESTPVGRIVDSKGGQLSQTNCWRQPHKLISRPFCKSFYLTLTTAMDFDVRLP
jgi:hypothetical protein